MHISIGAKGLAKQVLPLFKGNRSCIFFDQDKSIERLHDHSVIHEMEEIQNLLSNNDSVTFSICIANPVLREKFHREMISMGAIPINIISNQASVATNQKMKNGNIVLDFALIETDVEIGEGNLINCFAGIFHDVQVGDFNEVMPGARLLGGSKIGDRCRIGTNACILPNLQITDDVVIGAGSVVTRNIDKPGTYVGSPAKRLNK